MGNQWSKSPAVKQKREAFTVCPGCGRDRDRIYRERPHEQMTMNMVITVEHLDPRSQGGKNNPDNLILVCHRCNFTRGSQTPWDWYGEQHMIYAQGWPVPPIFFGKDGKGAINRRLWENRARMIAALLGQGPVEFDGDYHEGDMYAKDYQPKETE